MDDLAAIAPGTGGREEAQAASPRGRSGAARTRTAGQPRHPAGTAAGWAAGLWLLFRSGDAAKAARNRNTTRLVEAAAARGIATAIVDPARLDRVDLRGGGSAFTLDGRPVGLPAAAILRTGGRLGHHGVRIAGALAAAGVAGLGEAEGIAAAADKLLGARLLARAGLAAPRTIDPGAEPDPGALGATLGWPFVLKARAGSKGREVRLCRSPAEARAALAALAGAGPLIAQEWIAASAGRDLRVLVVGERVAGAMRRVAPPGEFRSNIACGGRAEAALPDARSAALALAAARAAGLPVAGIDILAGDAGPLVCEINAAPGFEALEAASGADIAGQILDHLAPGIAARHAARNALPGAA